MFRFAPLSRRRLLGIGGLALTTVMLPPAARAQAPAAAPVRQIAVRKGEVRLAGPEQPATPLTGFDGGAGGPLLRVRRGEDVAADFVNETAEPLTIRWRGYRIANALDGVAGLTQEPVAPGKAFQARFKASDAGTYLYQALPLHGGALANRPTGVLIVDEAQPPAADKDIVFLIEDWRLDEKQALADTGRPVQTINGAAPETIEVARHERLRLRLANASLTRFLKIRVEQLPPEIIALDGQPAEPFRPKGGELFLSPGGRADMLIDVTTEPETSFRILVDRPGADPKDLPVIATFRVSKDAPKRPAPLGTVTAMAGNGLPEQLDQSRAQRAEIAIESGPDGQRLTVAGKPIPFDARKPLFSVKRGRTIALGLVNRTNLVQAVHVHGHAFRLLDAVYDGWQPYWLDTALIPPVFTQRIAFLADNPGKWAIASQPIEGKIAGPMTWFEVT